MKKILFSVSILFFLSISIAEGGYSSAPIGTITKDLSFKNIMRALYGENLFNENIYTDYFLEKHPNYIGLIPLESNEDNVHIAYLHQVIEYKTKFGENRYVVPIEIVDSIDNEIISSHQGTGLLNLFLFKKNKNNNFELLSKSGDIENTGRNSLSVWEEEEDKNYKIQRFGDYNILLLNDSVMYMGHSIVSLQAFLFDVGQMIIHQNLGVISEVRGSVDESSPLYYEYFSEVNIVNIKNKETIKIEKRGEAPINKKMNIIKDLKEDVFYTFNSEKNLLERKSNLKSTEE